MCDLSSACACVRACVRLRLRLGVGVGVGVGVSVCTSGCASGCAYVHLLACVLFYRVKAGTTRTYLV